MNGSPAASPVLLVVGLAAAAWGLDRLAIGSFAPGGRLPWSALVACALGLAAVLSTGRAPATAVQRQAGSDASRQRPQGAHEPAPGRRRDQPGILDQERGALVGTDGGEHGDCELIHLPCRAGSAAVPGAVGPLFAMSPRSVAGCTRIAQLRMRQTGTGWQRDWCNGFPDRRAVVMSRVPEPLADLARRAQAAVDAVDTAGDESRETLVSRIERTHTEAERLAVRLHPSVIAAEREATDRWARIQADWKDHVLSMRSHVHDQPSARDAGRTERRAAYAERYAEAAIAVAIAAVKEAEYAVLDATLARTDVTGTDVTGTAHRP
jgi:hypothetical protein